MFSFRYCPSEILLGKVNGGFIILVVSIFIKESVILYFLYEHFGVFLMSVNNLYFYNKNIQML